MKKTLDIKKLILLNMPYILLGLFATNFGEAWRMAQGADASEKFLSLVAVLPGALQSFWPSLHPLDLLVGLCCGVGLRLAVYLKSKNAKKYRHGLEYGSARWGTREDIAPYVDPVFQNNVILTKTESLTMNSRPKDPKTARNKNVLVIGGSGSGKTRFWLKPNLMQMHSSYVVTDPKGTILVECGKMLQRGAPKLGKDGKPMKDKHGKVIYEPYRIKVLNTINFKKSMHYNPFAYIHSEKDILKLVTTLIANTKGEGKAGDDFWVKAETLLYCALIGYIHYEAPVEEQNFSTLIEFINAMEVREDDEEFKNPVDLMFDALEAEKPNHFAVRQYKKYKLAAGLAFQTSGTLDLWGKSSAKDLQEQRKRIGCMIETPALFPAMTAYQNMEIQRIQRGIPDKAVIEKTLNMVGLKDTGKKSVRNFSLGMRQRLGIAIALLNTPEFLILDEPINGLDPAGIVEVRNLLKSLNKEYGMTILVSSHILEELYQTATEFILIDKGKIIEEISDQELNERCKRHIAIKATDPQKALLALEEKLHTENFKLLPDGTIRLYDYLDDLEKVAAVLSDEHILVTGLSVSGDTLEDYFLSKIGGSENVKSPKC